MKFKWCEWKAEGAKPIWYHGRAYIDFERNRIRTWIVPLHLAVAAWMRITYWWYQWAHKSHWVDEQVLALWTRSELPLLKKIDELNDRRIVLEIELFEARRELEEARRMAQCGRVER
jgi:hypothetical protein